MLKPNSKLVYNYVKSNPEKTAADIAEGTGLSVKQVNGIVTAAFQRKGLMERIPAKATLEDGTEKDIKLIRLTAEGESFDPEATDAE